MIYGELVDKYVKPGCWYPIDKASAHSVGLPPSEVFAIGVKPGDRRKPRLVVDAVQLNINFGKPSCASAEFWTQLAVLRLLRPKVVFCTDSRLAFLKVKLKNVHMVLHTGVGTFSSHSMCFGNSFGTGALAETHGLIVSEVRQADKASCGEAATMDFVDDITTACKNPGCVVSRHLTAVGALLSAGFDCSASKAEVAAVRSECRSVSEALGKGGVGNLQPKTQFKLLGAVFHFAGEGESEAIVANCSREERMADVISLLDLLHNGKQLTNSQYPIDKASAHSVALPPSEVFAIGVKPGDRRKSNLVVDAVQLNKNFGKPSCASAEFWTQLAVSRLLRPKVVFCTDSRLAFLKVKLKNVHMVLHTGVGTFSSH